MKKYFKKLKSYFIDNDFKKQLLQIDNRSYQNLLPLIVNHNYLPFNSLSLRPYAINFICNEVIINQRESIVEFGSGLSTILLARLAKSLSIDFNILSIDENQDWINIIQKVLKKDNTESFVKLVHSPLVDDWYNKDIVSRVVHKKNFDMLIIDGPTAGDKSKKTRYEALSVTYQNLSTQCMILLDDLERVSEKRILDQWSIEFNDFKFSIYSKTIGVGYRGGYFISDPNKGYYDHFIDNYKF